MKCHNGSLHNDYAGPGLENPHAFPGDAEMLLCTKCQSQPTSKSRRRTAATRCR